MEGSVALAANVDARVEARSVPTPRVAVAVCTYRRPAELRRLLSALATIDFEGDLRVDVVENDSGRAGYRACQALSRGYRWPLDVDFEPRAGISHARNRAVARALEHSPDFVALLDDDEWPERQWLGELLRVARQTGADIVGGPVVPRFDAAPPGWERHTALYGLDQRLPDGAPCVLYGAGNVLLRAECLQALPGPFDTAFATTGGEDLLLFAQLARRGYRMHWAAEAVVHEDVPPDRATEHWLRRRQRRRGCTNIAVQRRLDPGWRPEALRVVKTAGALALAGATALAGLVDARSAEWARLRADYALGRLIGHFGAAVEEYRRG